MTSDELPNLALAPNSLQCNKVFVTVLNCPWPSPVKTWSSKKTGNVCLHGMSGSAEHEPFEYSEALQHNLLPLWNYSDFLQGDGTPESNSVLMLAMSLIMRNLATSLGELTSRWMNVSWKTREGFSIACL
jgi:hypothetical protein